MFLQVVTVVFTLSPKYLLCFENGSLISWMFDDFSAEQINNSGTSVQFRANASVFIPLSPNAIKDKDLVSPNSHQIDIQNKNLSKSFYLITGMTCASCVAKIERELKKKIGK